MFASVVAVCVPAVKVFLLFLLFAMITAVMDTAENVIANNFFNFFVSMWLLLESTIIKQPSLIVVTLS